MSSFYFEDLAVGQVFETAARMVERHEILDFARAFDPNPFHLSDDAAQAAGSVKESVQQETSNARDEMSSGGA